MNSLKKIASAVGIIAAVFTIGCSETYKNKVIQSRLTAPNIVGTASYYHPKLHGRLTASGEKYNKDLLTAAHKSMPFGTMIKVVNLSNNKEIILRVNDRGPYAGNRVLDVSNRAASELDFIKEGIAKVAITILEEDGNTPLLAYNN